MFRFPPSRDDRAGHVLLKQTFLHIQGIGEVTERKLWSSGIRTWSDLLQRDPESHYRQDVALSVDRFEHGDWKWFDQAIPSAHRWRAFGDFPESTLYVDIETDGGMGPDSMTVIGAFDGRETRMFVAGENLDDAREYIEGFPVIATYNGSLFDMPIIRSRFTYNLFNHIHIDLRFPLHRLGLKGGLKRVEQLVGIERSAETAGLSGWDAVRLWREYQRGSREALQLMLEYNAEDVRNLKPLMELVFNRLSQQSGVIV